MAGDAILATLILAVMCFAMWMLARVAKRRMGVGSGTVSANALRVVGKRPLDQKSSIYVVEIAGGRHILLGSGADGTVTKLDDISADEYALMVDEDNVVPLKTSKARRKNRQSADDATEQRFATVGESFSLLLNKARNARGSQSSRSEHGVQNPPGDHNNRAAGE